MRRRWWAWLMVGAMATTVAGWVGMAAELPRFVDVRANSVGEMQLQLSSAAGYNSRLEASTNLVDWSAVYTFPSASGVQTYVDGDARSSSARYYRLTQLGETNALTGDHLNTSAGDVVIRPVNHASLVLGWKDAVIYCDPVGGGALYRNLPKPTLVLVTDVHSDHMDSVTLNAIGASTNAVIVAPLAVFQQLSSGLRAVTRVLTNAAVTEIQGIRIEAVPMYNLTPSRLSYHSKGRGNGYVLTIGGKRLYVSGDTEDIPEMRALRDIDAAFVCMNLPFTMDIVQASSAVREFRPRTVYPYHYSSSDVVRFKQSISGDSGVEVRLRKWY